MMEEVQTIFAVGAGAVSKFVKRQDANHTLIQRFSNPKYPYEYLRMAGERRDGICTKKTLHEEALEFFGTES